MPDQDLPQLYLVTPPTFEPEAFSDLLGRALDAVAVACVRLDLATRDEDAIGRGADAVREVCHARDVAVVLTDHLLIAERHGLDGVHFSDGARHVRKARTELGADAIVGAYCGASRHEGLVAAENGADYVSFGPVGSAGLGDGTVADRALFQWWSEMIEVPVVAEGGLTEALVRELAPVADFLAFGEEVWAAADPVAALTALAAARGQDGPRTR